MRIEIICTGDEVLTGKIVNTNFSYMSQKIEDFGLSVVCATTVRNCSQRFGYRGSGPTRSSSMAGSAPRSTTCRRRLRRAPPV